MTAPAGQPSEGSKRPGFLRSAVAALSTLQFKATAIVVILTVFVTVAVSGYLLQSSGQIARAQHEAELLTAASLLSDAAAALIDSGDQEQLQDLAIELANGQPLLYVIVSDKDGRQLAVSEHKKATLLQRLEDASQAPVPGVPVMVAQAQGAPLFLDVTYPITLRHAETYSAKSRPTELLGYVRTGMKGNTWQQGMASKLDLAIGVGVLSLLAAVPLGFLLIRRIVAPLDGLSEAMLQFSQGRLDVRSRIVRNDEIGRLAKAFNQMADQHQQTNQRMRRLNAELEERVAHRTQQLRELASREPLTGLYNRRYFNDTMERRFAEAMRYGDDLACVMIDLDDFKHANDTFGHQVGDELLILTARTLLGQLRAADVAARFGGDEFVLLLPQTDCDQARSLAERIIERFTGELAERFPEVRVSMSIGISSMHHSHAPDAESLVRAADHALYDAKSKGKNKVRVFTEVETAAAAG
jgi:diguanylate cyclase (GGDEF)-like protein